jgi:hypothetical protein
MTTESSSSSQANTAQTDNRRIIGQGGISAENSTVTVNTLDAVVANHALDASTQDLSMSLGFAGAAADKALSVITDNSNKSYSFATDNSNKSYSFATDNSNKSYSFAANSESKAFDFASKAQGQALDSLNTTSNLVKDAYADAKGRGALTDKILIGAIAMAGLVAIAALRK